MGNKGHILIIDDEAPVRYAISRILLREGYQVSEAASGMEALQMLSPCRIASLQTVDLMLMDLNLSDMSGSDLLQNLVNIGNCPPVLVFTGEMDSNASIFPPEARRMGYLLKPLPLATVLAAVAEALEQLSTKNTTSAACAQTPCSEAAWTAPVFPRLIQGVST